MTDNGRIGGVVMPPSSYRAHYLARSPDTGRLALQRWPVLGWAAVGPTLWPLRLEDGTGKGILVGHDTDPLLEGFLGVLLAGAGVDELGPEVDQHVRDLIRAEAEASKEVDHAEEG